MYIPGMACERHTTVVDARVIAGNMSPNGAQIHTTYCDRNLGCRSQERRVEDLILSDILDLIF
jgi:hypothetical protein